MTRQTLMQTHTNPRDAKSHECRLNASGYVALASIVFGMLATALMAAESAAPPAKGRPADVVGAPVKITVEPAVIALQGPRQFQHLLVTGHYADGSVRDLTRSAQYVPLDPKVAVASEGGIINAAGDGKTKVAAKVGSHEAFVEVAVANFAKPEPYNFVTEIVPAFTRARCNQGACHGTPSGKNGFRLSLQGYLPDQDYEVLTRETFGRRTNPVEPASSLILLKGTASIQHEGGKRLWSSEESYKVLHGWIAEGCNRAAPTTPAVLNLEILPRKRLLKNEGQNQQVVVIAHYADKSSRDVTSLVTFNSSDEQVASVTNSGLVSFHKRGSVAVICRYQMLVDNARLSYVKDVPGFVWSNPPESNYIDKHVFGKLRELQILPSEVCSDEEFVRRVYLDVTGMTPSVEQVQKFLADKAPSKRTKLIDEVLELPEYADFWAMKWADVLRNTRKQVAYRGAHSYRQYLVNVFAGNRPFNEFVGELLTGSGDTMINPPANYYRIARSPQDCAETTAQLFMGVRMQCAKCHNHPFERWTQDDYYGFAAFFARISQRKNNPMGEQELIVLARGGEVTHQRTGRVMPAKAPGVEPPKVGADEDRRAYLAQWLTRPDNPFFAKSVANRFWFHLMGKGIVDPVDDFRDSNPPCNDELINALAQDFVQSKFNVRQLLRTILNSRTYQLSARTNPTNADDEKYFSRCYTKLLTAEQLLDAICTSTMIPEKFAGLPLGTRATQLPDGEFNHTFLQAFGQPTRELACECARESESTLNQALNLINGNVIHSKLRDPNNRIGKLMAANKKDDQIIAELYLATLSRPAQPPEIEGSLKHIQATKDRRRALEDIHWALLNCKEFLFRH